MPLNFTGRAPETPPPAPAEDRGLSRFAVACLGVAAVAGLTAILIPLNRPKPAGPPLVGVSPAAPAPPPVPAPPQPPPQPSRAVAVPAPSAVVTPAHAAPAATSAAQPDRKARFVAALRRPGPGAITLAVEDDAGAQAYGRQLEALFREAGWSVNWTSVFGSGARMTGLSAALGSTLQDYAVRDAFTQAGVKLGPPPAAPGIVQTPELFIGAQP